MSRNTLLLLSCTLLLACQQPPTSPLPTSPPPTSPTPTSQLPFSPFPRIEADSPVALEIPHFGSEQPLVVIIAAGSYECDHTRTAGPQLEAILASVPEAALYWLHNPLPGHKQGYLLALAAAASQRQGRFTEFHKLLLERGPDLDEDRLLQTARRAGLDVPLFLKDMKRDGLKKHLEHNRTLVAALGLTGTPVFLVNGRIVLGWPGKDTFAGLVSEELKAARKLQTPHMTLAELHLTIARSYQPYFTVMDKGIQWDKTTRAPVTHEAWTRYRVPIEKAEAAFGPTHAPVTIVEYLDPTCRHSARAWKQAREVVEAYEGEVRILLKLNPALRDPRALEATNIAWSLRDSVGATGFLNNFFQNDDLVASRNAVCPPGVKCPIFFGRVEGYQELLTSIKLESLSIGAVGTPCYYINGLKRLGFLDRAALDALITAELELARSLKSKGIDTKEIYSFLTGRGATVSLVEAEQSLPNPPEGLRLGSSKAKFKLVAAWDFSSRFCRNLWDHLKNLERKLDGRLSIVLLPMAASEDPAANLLAQAAFCLFKAGATYSAVEHLYGLEGTPDIERLSRMAAKLGVVPGKFKPCLNAPPTRAAVQGWQQSIAKAGITGTPTVFIDGHRVRSPTGLDFFSLLAASRQVIKD
jgi:protein-disulfide isomerase